MASYKPVTAALRVLDVLTAVNKVGHGATVGDIHRQTELDKATIVRMLTTLAHAGYIVRDEKASVYRVTGKTLQLSSSYDRHTAISLIISQDLKAFRQEVGWPSDVAIFDRDAMVVVDSSRHIDAEPLQFQRSPGFRAPVLLTSLGLAYLANCPEKERNDFLSLVAQDPHPNFDLARRPEELNQKLAQVREQGYATMDESYSLSAYSSQFFSIGVPIMLDNHVFGSINIVYLRNALTPEEARNSFLTRLKEVALKMAHKLSERTSRIGDKTSTANR